jgi:hypothetical protein
MSKRTIQFISALVATLLAGASFTAVAENGTESADSCLSAPNGTAPAGSHWYYRLDRSTKRKCWYVRGEINKPARVASAQKESAPPAEAANPQPAAAISPSVADARAELTASQANARQKLATVSDSAPSNVGSPGSDSPVSTRWLDQSSMASSGGTKVASNDTAASPPEETQAEPQPTAPPAAGTAHATVEKQSTSTLLFIMAGTLALAGMVGGVIFRLNRASAPPYEIDNEWRAPWDRNRDRAERAPQLAVQQHQESPSHPVEPPRPRRVETAQAEPSFEETQREIKEMLARLAKSATA